LRNGSTQTVLSNGSTYPFREVQISSTVSASNVTHSAD